MSGASAGGEIPVICGPTAAGKSGVALWLAERVPITLISADSRQVYRGFDIGTAKPSAEERRRVPHRGIDIVDPAERYSAAAWAAAARGWIEAAAEEGRVPVVVGGTGLYVRALFEGLFEEPELVAAARAALARVTDEVSTAELRRWVEHLDPPRAGLGRTQLLRAVEIALLTGHRVSDLHRDRPTASRLRPHYLLVDPGPVLAQRIESRIDDMLTQGWLDEVRGLMRSVPASAPAWNATGYDAVRRVAMNELSLDEARHRILVRTRQYAKRQRTWFRHQLPPVRVTRLDPRDPEALPRALAWLTAVRPLAA